MHKKTVLLIISILVLVLIAGSIVYLFVFNKKDITETKTETTTSQGIAQNKSTLDYLSSNKQTSLFYNYLKDAAMLTKIEGVGPYTLFVPDDNAFKAINDSYKQIIFDSSKPQILNNILSYHITEGNLDNTNITNGQKVKTITGQEVLIEQKEGNIYVIDAKGNKAVVKTANIKTKNGVIYIIDSILLPQ